MVTKLTQLPVQSAADILRVHEIAMQAARWAGLPEIEQVRFGAAIAEQCYSSTGKGAVIFSIEKREDGRCFLKACAGPGAESPEKEILLPDGKELPSFPEATRPKTEHWEDEYKDMQQFTFALAHDLKNSLTKLKLALSLLEEEEIPETLVNYVQIIHRASARLETIMVNLNKVIQVGDSSPDVVKTISPALVFADIYEEFSEALVKSGAVVATDFMVSELNYIDVYLKSIFANLLSNAIKYAAPQRPLQVRVSARRQHGKTVFTFSDNGQGIDLQAHGDKLFQPFTRFSTNTEGSGIGLYLVKNIVERNGGKIEVESVPGQGTTFRLFLQEYKLPAGQVPDQINGMVNSA